MSLWQPWPLAESLDDAAGAWARAQERIARTEPALHAWVEFAPTDSHTEPVAGPLAGVPIGVKDIVDVAGLPTRCGSALYADAPAAAADAPIVARLRAAGARVVGKTVTTEFAYFAPGPTVNPASPDLADPHTPGGSSSGSAAAVASGQVPLAVGSQTAGSVTRPASYCGVAALVVSHDRLPTDGVTGLSHSLDSLGLLAARPADVAAAFAALEGTACEPRLPRRVLVWRAKSLGVLSAAMGDALEATATALASAGVEVVEVEEGDRFTALVQAHPVLMAHEAAHERAEELARADELSAPLATLLRTGAGQEAAEVAHARTVIDAARADLTGMLTGETIILGPAAPGAAPRGLAATGDPILSRPWQAIGVPQVTIPGHRDADGLPLGLQLIAAHGRDEDALGFATALADLIGEPR